MNRRAIASSREWLERKLNKPYYVLRPRQMARRLRNPGRLHRLGKGDAEITLPWGWPLEFRANEQTGRCLLRRGVFDLAVCEARAAPTDLRAPVEERHSMEHARIVFEQFDVPPTPVTRLLESRGYAVFSLDQTLLGPKLGDPGAASRSGDDPSYLATLEPDRVLRRLGAAGWRVFRVRPARRSKVALGGPAGTIGL